eukprot:TRINITY_DN12120_c0_g1_i2.p2 TRINITY_DN12120_c0_g1~~TRINITY_DN12120_c0_g1_i2.p2  ORF type:complete len:133 (+),score=19.60 TRINITY_DN12120_c0_g1_i2:1547-1945(+)
MKPAHFATAVLITTAFLAIWYAYGTEHVTNPVMVTSNAHVRSVPKWMDGDASRQGKPRALPLPGHQHHEHHHKHHHRSGENAESTSEFSTVTSTTITEPEDEPNPNQADERNRPEALQGEPMSFRVKAHHNR